MRSTRELFTNIRKMSSPKGLEGAEWYEPEHYHYVFNNKLLDFWKEINGVKE